MIDGHKPNHKCRACGLEYYACDSCDKKISKTWRTACCTEDHYKAYWAMWQYCNGDITKAEAKAVLAPQNPLEWVNAPEPDVIREIMAEDPAEKVEETAEPELVIEPEPEVKAEPVRMLGHFKKQKRR